MVTPKTRQLEVDARNINQNAKLAIRDIFDAIEPDLTIQGLAMLYKNIR